MPATPTATSVAQRLRVQTASVWGDTSPAWVTGGWTTQAGIFVRRCSVGIGQSMGSATIWRPVSSHVLPGQTTITSRLSGLDLAGKYVRILQPKVGGPFTIDSVAYGLLWAGRIQSAQLITNNDVGSAYVEYVAAGVTSLLDQCYPWNWNGVGQGADTSGVLPLTLPPAANDTNAPNGNEVSTAGAWDLSSAGVKWTWSSLAKQILEESAFAAMVGGPSFTWGDIPATVTPPGIVYEDQWSVASESALSAMLKIASPRCGLTLRADVDEATGEVTLNVNTSSPATVTWGTPTQTIPKSAEAVSVNLATIGVTPTRGAESGGVSPISGGVSRFSLSVDHSNVFDEIYIAGGVNWYACTLSYQASGGQLAKGWDTALEATWDDSATNDTERAGGAMDAVWSRFVLPDTWGGEVYDGSGTDQIPTTRDVAAGEPTNGGYNGVLSGTVREWTKGRFELTKTLPLQEGYDWDTQSASGVDQTRDLMQPQCYVYDGATWYTLAEYAQIDSVSIRVDNDGSITVGPLTACKKLSELVDSTGYKICFSVGIKHWRDLMVSWINPATPPTDALRVLVREAPKQQARHIMGGFIARVDSDGVVYPRSTTETITTDVESMLSALRLMSFWYGTPAVSLSWSYEGAIVPLETINVGQLVTTASVPYLTDATAETVTVNNVITQIEWDFSGDIPSTSYTTQRLTNDAQARL